jgi:multimeric flavodoxin WrbA
MPKYILESGTFVIITRIKYGCYTSYVKNVLDRSIGFMLPFFQTVNGSLHHTPRYNKSPKFVVIGYGDDITSDEEQTLKELVKGNALNFQCKDYKTYVIKNISEAKTILADYTRRIYFMTNLCFINGSPRKEKSGSSYLLSELVNLLDKNIKTKEYYIGNIMNDKTLLEEIICYDKIIFASPLYVDCFPNTMLEFMAIFEDFIKDKNNLKIDMYCLVNCGFLESTQNRIAINIMKIYCKRLNFNWRFELGIGGGEFMTGSKSMPLNSFMKKPIYNAFLALKEDIETNSNTPINNILVNPKIPTFIYKLA